MSKTFILIVEVIKQYIKIKPNNLPIYELIFFKSKTPAQGQAPSSAAKTKGASQSEITGLVLKTSCSRLGHMQY